MSVALLEIEEPDAKIRRFAGSLLSFHLQVFWDPLTIQCKSQKHLPSSAPYLELYGHSFVLLQPVFLTLLAFEEVPLASLLVLLCLQP